MRPARRFSALAEHRSWRRPPRGCPHEAAAGRRSRARTVANRLSRQPGFALMMADHPHTIDRWDDTTGETLIEQIAAVGDYLVALETYRAAVQRCPNVKITLRNRARVIEQSWGG